MRDTLDSTLRWGSPAPSLGLVSSAFLSNKRFGVPGGMMHLLPVWRRDGC
jgi:hypothetical protein